MDRLLLESSVMRLSLRVLLTTVCIGASASTDAQARQMGNFSLDLSIGRGHGRTDALYMNNTSGMAADALLGWRFAGLGSGGVVGAVNVGIQGSGAHTDICIQRPQGGCIPPFPEFRLLSLLVGWEPENGMFRLLTGPVYVHEDGRGWQGHVDVALPVGGRLSLLFNTRGVLVTSYQDATFQLVSIGAGLRIR